jgi:hypothetical protein
MELMTVLAPTFAAGFAVQQLLEIVTSFLELDTKKVFEKYKKAILGLIAVVIGFALAYKGYLQVLHPLFISETKIDPTTHKVTYYYSRAIPDYLDFFVTGLVLSAGTEGINSILKFMKYKKEEVKKEADTPPPPGSAIDRK